MSAGTNRSNQNLDAIVQRIRDINESGRIHIDVRRKIEFARPGAAPAELGNELSAKIENGDLMKLRVRDQKPVSHERESGRPLQLVRNIKLRLAFLIERHDFSKRRVGHKNGRAMSGDGHGRLEQGFARRLPARPFFPGEINATDGVGASVRDKQISGVVEREAKRFVQPVLSPGPHP